MPKKSRKNQNMVAMLEDFILKEPLGISIKTVSNHKIQRN